MYPLNRISLASVLDYIADRIAETLAQRFAREFNELRLQLHIIKTTLKIEGRIIMSELSDLTQEVADTKAGEEAAIVALAGIEARLTAAIEAGDPAKLVALRDSLAAERVALAAAIVAIPPAP